MSCGGVAEGTMDVESVQAIAPQAMVLYYFASLGAFGDAVNAVVHDGRAKIAYVQRRRMRRAGPRAPTTSPTACPTRCEKAAAARA